MRGLGYGVREVRRGGTLMVVLMVVLVGMIQMEALWRPRDLRAALGATREGGGRWAGG